MDDLLKLFSQHKVKIGGIIILLIAAFLVFSPMKHEEPKEITAAKIVPKEETAAPPKKREIKVDIKGAVKFDGVYPAVQGDRVQDILHKAEPRENADLEAVNLALEVQDQMVIYIPFRGEVKENKYEMYGTQRSSGGTSSEVVSINQADETKLQEIPGIGPKKAQEIISYREANGGFKSKEELKEIKGIGDKTYKTLEPFIDL